LSFAQRTQRKGVRESKAYRHPRILLPKAEYQGSRQLRFKREELRVWKREKGVWIYAPLQFKV
jgi:hypothetical protein